MLTSPTDRLTNLHTTCNSGHGNGVCKSLAFCLQYELLWLSNENIRKSEGLRRKKWKFLFAVSNSGSFCYPGSATCHYPGCPGLSLGAHSHNISEGSQEIEGFFPVIHIMVIFHICTSPGSLHSIFISIISYTISITSLWLPGISIIQTSQQEVQSPVLLTNLLGFLTSCLSWWVLHSWSITTVLSHLNWFSLLRRAVSCTAWAGNPDCWKCASHSPDLTTFLSGRSGACRELLSFL